MSGAVELKVAGCCADCGGPFQGIVVLTSDLMVAGTRGFAFAGREAVALCDDCAALLVAEQCFLLAGHAGDN